MIRSGTVGDDTCTNFQVQGNRFTRIECHYFIAHLDLHCRAGVIAETELDSGRLRFGEHSVNRRRNACRSSIDSRSCKERSSDNCDSETIQTLHVLAPDTSKFDGSYLPGFIKLYV